MVRQRVALVVILLTAAGLRFVGLDWDDFQHHHPDERYISWVATTIEFSRDWDPTTATFNPFRWPPDAASEGIVVLQDEPRDFAYGHVPLYLGVLATRVAERLGPWLRPLLPAGGWLARDVLNGAARIEFHHLTAVGRTLTALFDVGTVLVTYLLGKRLFGAGVGLLAAAWVALTVQHIQLAHFFTSDPYLTFFVLAALWAMVAAGQTDATRRRRVYLLLAAAFVGLAIGSKFTAVLLAVPLVYVAWRSSLARWRWAGALLALGVAFVVFAVTNPFALLDNTCELPANAVTPAVPLPDALLRNCYLQEVATQSAMVRGSLDLAFTRQYDGTLPYLYFIEMQLRWGMGPLLGLVAFVGLGWVLWRLGRSGEGSMAGGRWHALAADPLLIPLLWLIPYFILTGSFHVKFMRYMLPILPLLVLFGAALLWRWRGRWAGRVALIAVSVVTAAYALAFVGIYGQEHPWNSASRWVHSNVPPGTTLLSERYDDYLPATMEIDGEQRRREAYENRELTWLALPDDEAKLQENLEQMARADYVTVLSNRVYGVTPRQPERYPLSSRYHQLLFDDALGYELVWVGGRSPSLLGVALMPDLFGWPGLTPPAGLAEYLGQGPNLSLGRVDESFVVYDQPLTMIFRNTGRLTAEEMRAAFDAPTR